MRVLMVCAAHKTHYFHVVPLAWALRTAGHEVRVAVPPELVDIVTGTGLTAVPIGVQDWYEDGDPLAARLYDRLLAAGGADCVQHFDYTGGGRWEWSWEQLHTVHTQMVAAFFDPMNNPRMIADLVTFARHWQPDLVVRDIYSFAGGIAAHLTGAAHARLIYGPDNLTLVREPFLAAIGAMPGGSEQDPVAEWLDRVMRPHGGRFVEDIYRGHWTIDQSPPSTRLASDLHTVGMRYTPYNGAAVVPEWLWEPPVRPRICLTGGVTRRDAGEATEQLAWLLSGLAGLDVEIVATMNAEQAASLPEVPANTRIVDFVPMNDLLPTCALIVHHGGAGTGFTAELHGVPQVVISDGWDTELKVARLAELGAIVRISADGCTPEAVRAAVDRVLAEPGFAQAAARLRAGMLAEPAPGEIVPVLEQLTTKHRTSAG